MVYYKKYAKLYVYFEKKNCFVNLNAITQYHTKKHAYNNFKIDFPNYVVSFSFNYLVSNLLSFLKLNYIPRFIL